MKKLFCFHPEQKAFYFPSLSLVLFCTQQKDKADQPSNQGGSDLDFGVVEEAIRVQKGVKMMGHDGTKASEIAEATLEMLPSSCPIKFQHIHAGSSKSEEEESSDSGSALNPFCSIKTETHHQQLLQQQQEQQMASDIFRTGPPQNQPPKHPLQKGGAGSEKGSSDAKTLRRLAQNREAARKCRIRKKAYVQQLETSRIRLAQLEQELQCDRAQGLLLGGAGGGAANISSGAAMFDMEYGRWIEEDERHMRELRAALQSAHVSEGELRAMVDAYVAHLDRVFELKGAGARADVFHLITGMWATPAERCFLWMAGFRPSDLIKMVRSQLADTLTEQQVMGLYSLQQSSQQAEDALTQGLDQLHHSLVDTVAGIALPSDGMHLMPPALAKISNLQGFVSQADNLRQQTLHQLCRILTVRQAARCFLVIGEYYTRLRALSHLWASRPTESMITMGGGMSNDTNCQTPTTTMTTHLQMLPPAASHNQFPTF